MEEIYFVGADGQSLHLTDYATVFLQNRRGWNAPKVEIFTEPLPEQPGARYNGRATRERSVSFSMLLQADGWEASQDLVAEATAILAQDGYLSVARAATERRLDVQWAGGLEGDTSSRQGPGRRTLVPEYRAVQPYWYDPTEQEQVFDTLLALPGVILPMALPVYFNSQGVNATLGVTAGTAPSPWRFHALGPFTRLEVNKLGTPTEHLDITYTVPAGQSLIISTYPGAHQVLHDNGFNQAPVRAGISTDSTFWQLSPGVNTVSVEFEGGTYRSGTFRWVNRYLVWG